MSQKAFKCVKVIENANQAKRALGPLFHGIPNVVTPLFPRSVREGPFRNGCSIPAR